MLYLSRKILKRVPHASEKCTIKITVPRDDREDEIITVAVMNYEGGHVTLGIAASPEVLIERLDSKKKGSKTR